MMWWFLFFLLLLTVPKENKWQYRKALDYSRKKIAAVDGYNMNYETQFIMQSLTIQKKNNIL